MESEEVRRQIDVIRERLEEAEGLLRRVFYELAKLSVLVEKEGEAGA